LFGSCRVEPIRRTDYVTQFQGSGMGLGLNARGHEALSFVVLHFAVRNLSPTLYCIGGLAQATSQPRGPKFDRRILAASFPLGRSDHIITDNQSVSPSWPRAPNYDSWPYVSLEENFGIVFRGVSALTGGRGCHVHWSQSLSVLCVCSSPYGCLSRLLLLLLLLQSPLGRSWNRPNTLGHDLFLLNPSVPSFTVIHGPPKRWYPATSVHDVATQTTST